MDDLFITIGPFAVRTFTALLAGAALLGLGALVTAAYLRHEAHPLHWFDAGLGALVGAVIGARLLHVLLAWGYFADHPGEIINLRAGGLSWHGAVYGGLAGLWLAARWRGVPFRPLTDVIALVFPLGIMAAWQGCWASACAYGAEVWTLADYPAWAVSEQPDVFGIVAPRYNVQVFGVGLGAALLLIMALVALAGVLRGWRLWLVFVLAGAGMFALSYLRGDQVASFLPGFTQDQLLDASVIIFSVTTAIYQQRLYAGPPAGRPYSAGNML